MFNHIHQHTQNKSWWLFLIGLALFLELSALYYQYVKDEWPCVLCIHIRIWLLGVLVTAIVALFLHRSRHLNPLLHIGMTVMFAGFTERSYQVLAIERGWTFGDCDMDSGLPDWFALDRWFPAIFEVKTSCGYTPYIFLQISMAEILMVCAVLLVISSTVLTISALLKPR